MNKQRYLAELQKLLVFMTEEDKALAIRHYGDMFDAVGEEGEAELARQLGSPTKAAIGLSRGYEPGSIRNLPAAPAKAQKPRVSLTQTQEDPWGDLPTFEIPDLDLPEDPATAEEKPEPKRKPDFLREMPEEDRTENTTSEYYYERSMPLGAGIALLVLVMLALGIPLAALVLALMAVCLAPGAAIVFGAYLAAVGGLWCLSILADAMLLFGTAFLILAVGLIVLWGGVWLCSRLAMLYVRGVQWLCGELLGRKVTVHE